MDVKFCGACSWNLLCTDWVSHHITTVGSKSSPAPIPCAYPLSYIPLVLDKLLDSIHIHSQFDVARIDATEPAYASATSIDSLTNSPILPLLRLPLNSTHSGRPSFE